MSVITEADEHLDSVKDDVRDAIKSLSKILIDSCFGAEDYTLEYKDILYEVYIDLMKIQRKLQ